MRSIVIVLIALAVIGWSAPSWADYSSTAAEVGSAAGSGLGTLIYAPLKATFCILGGTASGFTAIASPPTAGKVAMASCGGAWIVTPNVVRGREPVKFVGDTTPTPSRSTAAR